MQFFHNSTCVNGDVIGSLNCLAFKGIIECDSGSSSL